MAKIPASKKPAAKKSAPAPKAKAAPKKLSPKEQASKDKAGEPAKVVAVSPKPVAKPFPINMLSFKPELQMRVFAEGKLFDAKHLEDLREGVRNGDQLPPVKIMIVPGKGNLVYDGFHTAEAFRLEGKSEVPAVTVEGSWADAVKAATAANDEHKALKRTNEDKRNAVYQLLMLLRDTGEAWSNQKVADHVHVHESTVQAVRLRIPAPLPEPGAPLQSGTKANTPDAPAAPAKVSDSTTPVKADPPKVEGTDGKLYPSRAGQPRAPRKAPEKYSISTFENAFGALYRQVDSCGAVYDAKDGIAATSLRQTLNTFKEKFVRWHSDLVAIAEKKTNG